MAAQNQSEEQIVKEALSDNGLGSLYSKLVTNNWQSLETLISMTDSSYNLVPVYNKLRLKSMKQMQFQTTIRELRNKYQSTSIPKPKPQVQSNPDTSTDAKANDQATKNIFAKPLLPWAKDSLSSKGISQTTIEYHYGKHHLGYFRKLNQMNKDGKLPQNSTIESLIMNAKGKIYNLAAQIWNHSFYWESMIGDHTGGVCNNNFLIYKQLSTDFGSFDNFINEFKQRAKSHFGSGWIWLSENSKNNKLVITEGHDAVNPMTHDLIPLLTIDIWEHAYYIDQKNNRGAYVDNFIKCINWVKIEERYKTLC